MQALKEQYGAEGVVEGAKLFSIVMSKMFDSLTEAYKGWILFSDFDNFDTTFSSFSDL